MVGFVVFQAGSAILGVGATPAAAIEDAARNLGPGGILSSVAEAPRSGGLVAGALYVAPADDVVRAAVERDGGGIDYQIVGGRVVLA